MSEKIQAIINSLQKHQKILPTLYEDNYSKIISLLKEDCSSFEWTYDAGISKFVILIRGEPFVIKVPFHLLFDKDVYESDLEYWERGEEEDFPKPIEEDYIHSFENAMNYHLEDALGTEFKGDDYCEIECSVYQAAENEGLAQYFAPTEWQDQAGETSIYIQLRVTPFEAVYESALSDKETTTKCDSLGVRCFNSLWIKDFFDFYGEDEFIKLDAFLKKYQIYDLHSGNLGYLDGAPILLDYSDFNEW